MDIHALRHTFGTHLSKNGVAPRTGQAAMRHSSLDLTMNSARERRERTSREGHQARVPKGGNAAGGPNVYTDPELLDMAGAVDALPNLPLQGAAEAASSTVGWPSPTSSPDLPPLFLPHSAPLCSRPPALDTPAHCAAGPDPRGQGTRGVHPRRARRRGPRQAG